MHISLKKQIHKKKINTYIKSYDIVFFCAIFDLPQKSRQLLNFPVLLEKNKFKTKSFSSILGENSDKTHILGIHRSFSKNLLQKKVKSQSLYISNKCFKHLEFSYLPLHGQTILIATQSIEEALDLYNKETLLYKSIFLGGFVKSVFKTRTYYKALLEKTERKQEIYIFLLKAISDTNIKNLKVKCLIYCKYICLLKILVYKQKSKNNLLV